MALDQFLLDELESAGLVAGRARLWTLLESTWTRESRGETAQLANIADQALHLARETRDERAEADAQCLVGRVLQAQGQLEAARAAFAESLAISRRLAELDPSNARWQRDLAVAHSKVGGVLQARGASWRRPGRPMNGLWRSVSRRWGQTPQHPHHTG